MSMTRRQLELAGPADTERLGARLARRLTPPCVVWLEGELGAGKTTLARGLLRALGHAGNVKSPTYTLVESYRLPACSLHHLDLYRLADPEELEFLGIRELAGPDTVLLVEWPARGAGFLPPPDAVLQLSVDGEGRRATLQARTVRGEQLIDLPDDAS